MPKVSAVDAVTPAFENTSRLLFKPFRFHYWLRIGLLGILTGEVGGSGFNFNMPSNFNWPTHRHFAGPVTALPPEFAKFVPYIVPIIVFAILVGLIFALLRGVFRFVLFETVLGQDVTLGAGWKRWFDKGVQLFGWMLLLQIGFLIVLAVLAGGPLLAALCAGALSRANFGGAAVAAILWAVLVAIATAVLFTVVYVFSKDFVVPMMALENLSFSEAWRRLWALVKQQFGSFAAYVGMKIILSIAGGIFLGIISLVLIIIFAIPVGIVIFFLVSATHSGSLVWSVPAIAAAVGAGIVVLLCFIYCVSVAGSPITIFFPSYGLYFFAGRYPPLEQILFPMPTQGGYTPPAPMPA